MLFYKRLFFLWNCRTQHFADFSEKIDRFLRLKIRHFCGEKKFYFFSDYKPIVVRARSHKSLGLISLTVLRLLDKER